MVLQDLTHIGKGYLNNITIIGNKVTVACNNSGILSCLHCSNIFIKGITWDQCGNPDFINAIGFKYATNISITNCTFQHSKVCMFVVIVLSSGFIRVQDSRFLFNTISNSTTCPAVASLAIFSIFGDKAQNISVSITGTLFYHNGANDYAERSTDNSYSACAILCFIDSQHSVQYHIENSTVNSSFGIGSLFMCLDIFIVNLQCNNVTFSNNSNGGLVIMILGRYTEAFLGIRSCSYTHNTNGSLVMKVFTVKSNITLYRLTVAENKGTFVDKKNFIGINSTSTGQGVGISIWSICINSSINISYCNIQENNGGKSIVYIKDDNMLVAHMVVSLISSNFTNNVGSALFVTGYNVELEGYVLFMNNSAERGAAMYCNHGSQIYIKEYSTIEFIGNTALQQGGAIYVTLPFNCSQHKIVFTFLSSTSTVSFANNSAGLTGNSIYFSIPAICDVARDPNDNNSLVRIPYNFNYTQQPGTIGSPVISSPYKIILCSTACNLSDNNTNCTISSRIMLGQSTGINATICDYYGNVSDIVQFLIECTNCNDKYKLSSNKILAHHGLFDVTFLAVDADSDIVDSTNLTLSLSSVLSDKYRQLTATVSMILSSCHSGYVFDQNLQRCVCYEQTKEIIQCQQDYAEIRYGYWFGIAVFPRRTVSLCPIHYCDYNSHAATSNGYYKLPEELDGQCSSHRTGVACGECKPGYTLTYDSPNCINTDKCSTGMTVLVVALTILYWIIIVALVFGLMQIKLSLGYAYGLIYYYSIIDILLGSNLFFSDGVYQLVTILSSFAKLSPQFLGKLCFMQGLSGIDQQFIHYFHAIFIFFIIGIIVIVARRSPKIASIVSRCIIRVICLLILLSYTSLASASLQLLRPLHFADVNGAYVYSSPSIKYFTGRHIPYGIIALLCGLFIVIGLPLLLLLKPFLKYKVNFIKIKPLLDQYQESYKDQYHWFAAYYLVCRLVIIAIVYASNFISALYYLQTACIIIVAIHVWIKPYKSETLNVLDAEILLIMVLIIYLNSFTFSRSTTILIIVLVIVFPLILSVYTFLKVCCSSICMKKGGPEEIPGNQRPGPHRFQGNDEFVGISSSHESLVKLMEILDEVEDYKSFCCRTEQ